MNLAPSPSTAATIGRATRTAGLVAGTLDLAVAFVQSALTFGSTPLRVLQAIASGLLGKAAFSDGAASAVLGLVCHFLVAFGAAAAFALAARVFPVLLRKPVGGGMIHGALVYLVMNAVVLPLSAIAFHPDHRPLSVAIGIATHVFVIGVPISLLTRREFRRGAAPTRGHAP